MYLQKLFLVESANLTSDIVNLNEIINLLKGENGHLLMKSKLQKETRDMLEVKICTLENKLIYLQENVSKSKKRLKLNEEKEKLKQEKEMLPHNKYKQQSVIRDFSREKRNINYKLNQKRPNTEETEVHPRKQCRHSKHCLI